MAYVEQLFKYDGGADAIAAIIAADYFLPAYASKTLRAGDVIIAKSSNNGAVDVLIVNVATATNVTVVNGT